MTRTEDAHSTAEAADALPLIIMDVGNGLDAGREALEAAALVSLELPCELQLVGPERRVTRALQSIAHDAERLRVIDAGDHEERVRAGDPSAACVQRGTALMASQSDRAGALITAGHPADILKAARAHLEPLPHVQNPALAAVIPTIRTHGAEDDPFALLLDIGATPDPGVDDLVTFAAMGTAYARLISANPRPRLGLLSNSSTLERTHDRLVGVAHAIAESADDAWDFVGPVRGDFVLLGEVDVLLAEGHSGEILVRTLDGFKTAGERLLKNADNRLHWRMAVGLLGAGIDLLREFADQENYGGAPLLGYQHAVVVCEPGARRRAFFNAARLALKMHRLNMQDELRRAVQRLHEAP